MDATVALSDFPASESTTRIAAQTTSAPAAAGGAAAPEAEGPHESTSELNRKLTNPVSTIWSVSNQFNNFRLANGQWNNNWNFEPVLPVSLTSGWNLITRPVMPFYNIVPHETAPGQFERTAGLGDRALLEMLSPADSGNWILGAGPTFIFPTATSKFTGQGKWQAGPGVVVGYLTKEFILGVFPQQWFSIGGDPDRPATSQLNLQPIAAVFLGDGWNLGYSGNILANWKGALRGRVDGADRCRHRQGREAGAFADQAPAVAAVHAGTSTRDGAGVECASPDHARHPEAHQGRAVRVTTG